MQPITCNGKVLDDNRPNEGWSADVGRAGNVVLSALMASSPDDITGFATLTGDDNQVGVTLPFSVTLEGTTYNTVTVTTNGHLQFGTLAGANPFTNAALPSASFSGPTLFYYWDDLQPEGSNVRYGTVGTAPNRTFIVDFQENLVASSGDKVNGQVQVHEGSGLINVKYRSTLSANANGQSATIGFQGAGGGSAIAYPLTFNGKVLDDNRPDEGWSIHPRPLGAMSLHSLIEFSPDDITGFTTLSGDNAIAGVTLPFTFVVDGVSYTTLTIGTNGLVQFGTTTGANPTGNVALPSASFTGPTLFWYWDDLQTEGGNIRYGTVGSSPARTFIIDFQENTVAASQQGEREQIHEGSNITSVPQHAQRARTARARRLLQGAGGAAAYPLTSTADVTTRRMVRGADSGGNNSLVEGAVRSGRRRRRRHPTVPLGAPARPVRPVARAFGDVAETCTAPPPCPTDAFVQSSATVCRSSAGVRRSGELHRARRVRRCARVVCLSVGRRQACATW